MENVATPEEPKGEGCRTSASDLVRRLGFFCLPLLLVWGALEWFAAGIPNLYSIKRRQLASIADNVDTLILGSSNGYYGIAPEHLPGCAYNLANFGQSLYYDDQLLSQVVTRLPRLRRVIISFHYISLFSQLEEFAPERQYYYRQEWDLPPRRWRDRFDIRMWSALALRTPEVVVKELQTAGKSLVNGRPFRRPFTDPEVSPTGWGRSLDPAAGPPDLSETAAKRAVATHHQLMHPGNKRPNLHLLEHLLQTLQERDIEAVLVVPPVWKSYAAEMRPQSWEETRTCLTQLAHQYHARYLCFLTRPELGRSDFADLQHLSPEGAVRFSKILSAALQAPSGSESLESTRPANPFRLSKGGPQNSD